MGRWEGWNFDQGGRWMIGVVPDPLNVGMHENLAGKAVDGPGASFLPTIDRYDAQSFPIPQRTGLHPTVLQPLRYLADSGRTVSYRGHHSSSKLQTHSANRIAHRLNLSPK